MQLSRATPDLLRSLQCIFKCICTCKEERRKSWKINFQSVENLLKSSSFSREFTKDCLQCNFPRHVKATFNLQKITRSCRLNSFVWLIDFTFIRLRLGKHSSVHLGKGSESKMKLLVAITTLALVSQSQCYLQCLCFATIGYAGLVLASDCEITS